MEQTIKNIKESTEKMQEELAELSKVTEGLRNENKSLREEMNQLKLDLEVKLKRERIDAEEKYKLELDSLRSETFMRFTTNEASIENNFKNTVKNAAIIEAHGDDIVETPMTWSLKTKMMLKIMQSPQDSSTNCRTLETTHLTPSAGILTNPVEHLRRGPSLEVREQLKNERPFRFIILASTNSLYHYKFD